MVDGLRLVPPQAGRKLLGRPAPDMLRQLDLRRVIHDADIDSVEAIAVRGSSRAKAANTFSDWLMVTVRRVQGCKAAETRSLQSSSALDCMGLHGLDCMDCMDCMDWIGLHGLDCMDWTAFGGRRMCLRFKVPGLRYWAHELNHECHGTTHRKGGSRCRLAQYTEALRSMHINQVRESAEAL